MEHHTTTHLNKLLWSCDEANALEDRKCYIYARSKWSEDCVDLVLQQTKSNKCYKGKLSKQEMVESATELEIPFEEFYAEVQTALTANIAAPGFEYEIDETEEFFKLNKKQEEVGILYVEVKLHEVHNNFELLDTAIELISGEQQACSQKLNTASRNDKSFDELKMAFKEALEEKNSIEKKILKKCALLLNTKKEKIAELQVQLEQQRNGETNQSGEEAGDFEDYDEEMAADVEKEVAAKSNRNLRKPLATCKRNKTLPNESNNAAGEEEDEGEDEDDFMAATQQMTQLNDYDVSTIERPTKRSRTQLRILDETTDDLNLN